MKPLPVLVLALLLANDARAADFTFSDWAGPAISVRFAAPPVVTPCTPIVFVLHGASRDAERYFADWAPLAAEHDFVLVVPHFPDDRFDGAPAYNLGNVHGKDGIVRPEGEWTFSVIEPLFDAVVSRLGGRQTRYGMYGHSAGAQFVHRYRYFKPASRLASAVAANAGWYTLPLESVAWPYGLRESGVLPGALSSALHADLLVLLGTGDNATDAAKLRKTPEAEMQGPHRLARGETYYRVGDSLAEALGTPFGWRLMHVTDAGHDNALMAPVAARELSASLRDHACEGVAAPVTDPSANPPG